ncbi:amidase [Pseudohongiella sp. SYSU M77423]|uniref:amidase n=1 Tax=Pseudohongiella sp. SYSU M77423 TaxID=3042312 RepID=UPI0024801CCD|nr:amidase [Pseudohongiella sp. SYSU M77423]MDH7943613.1 amidase [Pseudohongiella sp. SYSU M77423]
MMTDNAATMIHPPAIERGIRYHALLLARTAMMGATALLIACSPPSETVESSDVSVGSTDASETAGNNSEQVPAWADVEILQDAMQDGELTAVALTEYYLQRIATYNDSLRAVIEVNPEALDIAARLDQERASGNVRSALHGMPVLLKDNIDTADAMKTTAGSYALLFAPTPAEDAFLVQQLREAGAVILGKANLSEWANFRSTSSSSGWSARGGQARNPYNALHTPCGSSSGSGVAVAADLTLLAVGTETNGSIICPSANNSVVGIKPTLGLISRSGVIPIAHSQDTAGPMTRTVADAAVMLSVMAGSDPQDAITDNPQAQSPVDYTQYLQADALSGKRIGVMRSLFGRNAPLDALMESQLDELRSAGATVVDIELSGSRELSEASYQVLLYEFKNDLNAYLRNRGGFYQSLEHLIRFNEVNASLQMPWFAQEIFLEAQATTDLTDPAYLEALQQAKSISQSRLDDALTNNQLDAIVAPSNGPGWLIDLENGDDGSSVNYVSSSGLAAIAGYPAITVPAGYIDGMPVGISFFGAAFSEPELIGLAYAYEQRTQARRAPELTSVSP